MDAHSNQTRLSLVAEVCCFQNLFPPLKLEKGGRRKRGGDRGAGKREGGRGLAG